jgi:hypothetical protein
VPQLVAMRQSYAGILQVHGHLAAVPGRAMGAVIAGLAHGLPAAVHETLSGFHTDVVAALRAAPDDGGAGSGAALQAALVERLPALRAAAGLRDAAAAPGEQAGGPQAGTGDSAAAAGGVEPSLAAREPQSGEQAAAGGGDSAHRDNGEVAGVPRGGKVDPDLPAG